jgi:ribosome-associated protein
MTDALHIRGSIAIPRDELSWRFSRSSGPGGQGVNTASSRVELSWDLAGSAVLPEALKQRAMERLAGRLVDGVLTVTASEHRAQLHNRRAAETRLVALLVDATAAPPRRRRPTRPSRGAVEARLDAKQRRGRLKKMRRDLGD